MITVGDFSVVTTKHPSSFWGMRWTMPSTTVGQGCYTCRGSWLLSPKKNGPRYERLGGSGELIFSEMRAAVYEPTTAHSVIG